MNPAPRIRRSRLGLAAMLAFFACSCLDTHPWREQRRPWTAASIAGARQVRVLRTDGTTVVLEHPTIVQDTRGEILSGKPILGATAERVEVQASEIDRLETSRTEAGRVVLNVAAWTVVVLVLLYYASEAAVSAGDYSFPLGF